MSWFRWLCWSFLLSFFCLSLVWADGLTEIQVKTSAGAPSNKASQGTLCYNSVDNILYVNTDGGTTWRQITVEGHADTGSFTIGGLILSTTVPQLQLTSSLGPDYELNADGVGVNLARTDVAKQLISFDGSNTLFLPQLNCSSNVNGGVLTVNNDGSVRCRNFDSQFIVASGAAVSRSVDHYVILGGSDATTTESGAEMPIAATCYNFRARVDDAPAGSTRWNVALQLDGVNTPLACNIIGASTSCNNPSGQKSFAAGNMIRAFFDAVGAVAATTSSAWSMVCDAD